MKPLPDSLTQYAKRRKLTDYDRRLLVALAQGYSMEQARHAKGAKRGISENHARRQAKLALIKLGFDLSKTNLSPEKWCYTYARNIRVALGKTGQHMFKALPHNDEKTNRQDKDLYFKVLELALNGLPRPMLKTETGLGDFQVNKIYAFWRRCLKDLYLKGEDLEVADEQFRYWRSSMGDVRHEKIWQWLRKNWRESERAEPFYERMRDEQTRASPASGG